ncbi:MAG TPA: DUF3616 domain-containing protein [Longimicrobium sp.]|nr:DUF3616 domain-containing protein [Longimicrobium sp.]
MVQPIRTVHLTFTPPPDGSVDPRAFREGLSAVVQVGRHLWLACDETATLERLTYLGEGRWGEHRTWPLADFVDLPGGGDEEVDVEGLAWSPPYLWLVGSHGRTRARPDGGDGDAGDAEQIERLAKVTTADNRYILARIPLADDEQGAGQVPVRRMPDPTRPSIERTAARLKGDGRRGGLMKALEDDPHLRRFLKVPGKDNGFDIEGLAADGERLFLGLRGPVLRGWAVVVEVEVKEDDEEGLLALRRIGPRKRRYRKHFLDLDGLGVRELAEDGDDLLVLAGPTMDVRAPAAVFRWHGALRAENETIVDRRKLTKAMDLPHDVDGGRDHPEGVCLFYGGGLPPAILVVYDAASRHRLDDHGGVRADVFALGG